MKTLHLKMFCFLAALQIYFTQAEIKIVTMEDDVQLECDASVDIHHILALTWTKDDTVIVNMIVGKHKLLESFPSKYKLIELTKLIILNITQSDLARYHCVISSDGGFVSGEFIELRAADSTITKFARVGDNIRVDCPVGVTSDLIDVQWMTKNQVVMRYTSDTDTEEINLPEKYGRHENNSLQIMNIQISESGDYTCTMSIGSNGTQEIIRSRYKLFIPVLVINNCSDFSLTGGCDCTVNGTAQRRLTCKSTGFPEQPFITWVKQTGAMMTRSVISWTSTINLDLESENAIFTCHAQYLTSGKSFREVASVCVIFSNPDLDIPPVLVTDSVCRNGWRVAFIVLCICMILFILTPILLYLKHKSYGIPGLGGSWNYNWASTGAELTQHMTGVVLPMAQSRYLGNKNTGDKTVINDPIHGTIEIPEYCRLIIDTPEFQRLRYIKQLGCAYYVYHTASHTRFDHAIGVCHLAGKVVTALRSYDNSITTTEVACVEIAGLCHDLGHGPFSHLFEGIAVTSETDKKWTHEEQSTIVFKHLIEKNSLAAKIEKHGIGQEEIDFICDLILGHAGESHHDKYFLYQIINNRLNEVDVDRWDYLTRDSKFLGIQTAFDIKRLIPFLRVCQVEMKSCETRMELCFRDKMANELNNMFQCRRQLHYAAYQHRVVRSIRVMMQNAFIAASRHLTFSGKNGKGYSLLESVNDPEAFCQVNDNVISEIMRSQSEEDGMVTARQILQRIHKRQLYQCIVQIKQANTKMHSTDPEEIKKHLIEDEEHLNQPNDGNLWHDGTFEIDVSTFHYGKGEDNPLLHIPFYGKSQGERTPDAQLINSKNPPADLPERLKDVTVRIYTKLLNPSKTAVETARDDFYKRCRALFRRDDDDPPTTPQKQTRLRHRRGTHSDENGLIYPLTQA